MKHHPVKTSALVLPYRLLLGRLSFILYIAFSIWLIASSKAPGSFAHHAAIKINDTLVPVITVLAKPLDAVSSVATWIQNMRQLEKENEGLQAENSRLRQWYAAASELKTENSKLRDLLKFVPAGKSAYISARVAADSGSPYSRSLLITSGSDNGVHDDAAVINERGMVGRVIDAGQKTARVLLLTDINSRIPVMSETSREHTIASGGDRDMLNLMYLPENSKLKVGEKIVTTGDGAVLPPGLPVGVVSKIDKGVVTVKPFADWYRIEYVSVIDFSM